MQPLHEPQRRGRWSVLSPAGHLDATSGEQLSHEVSWECGTGNTRLVLDLRAVPSAHATGMSSLLAALRVARQAGGDLRLASAPPRLTEDLRHYRLDRVLRLHETVEEAIRVGEATATPPSPTSTP